MNVNTNAKLKQLIANKLNENLKISWSRQQSPDPILANPTPPVSEPCTPSPAVYYPATLLTDRDDFNAFTTALHGAVAEIDRDVDIPPPPPQPVFGPSIKLFDANNDHYGIQPDTEPDYHY